MGAVELASLCRFGVFSAADARRAGIAPNRLSALVEAGQAHPLIRGWYSAARPADPADRHRLMTVAAYRRFDGRAMASHHSAMVLQGLPTHLADLSTVHLTRTIEGSSRRRPGVVLHPRLPGLPPADRVPVATAIVQAGLVGHPLTALVAADAALRARQVTLELLDAAVAGFKHHKAIAPVRAILAEADGQIASVGESILGHRLRRMGWIVEPQFEVRTDRGRRFADFRIAGTRVLVEFDGALKYDGRSSLFDEKQREDALRRAGWVVVRFVWSELDDVELIRRRVEDAIAASRR
jgi:very-short-patch-repair endonuclease